MVEDFRTRLGTSGRPERLAGNAPSARGERLSTTPPAPPFTQSLAAATPKKTSSGALLKLVAAVALVLTVGGVAASGVLTGGRGSGGAASWTSSNRSYSYYNDQYYDGDSYSPRWKKDGMFNRNEWTYDGPYDYSGYGSTGMKSRQKNADKQDPIYANRQSSRSVFDRSDIQNPAGNNSGADEWIWSLDPTYSPYGAGYSNPYENRILMTTGPYSDRTAWLDLP